MKYILGAISLILLIAIIAGAAFYFGQKSTPTSSSATPIPTSVTTQASPTSATQSGNTASPTPSAQTQSLSGGGILVFSAYTLTAPSDWTSQKETTQYSDMMTLSKNGYKLVIYQAAGGGGGCTYPGQAPQEMAQTFSSFVEIMNPNGFVFRRGPTQGTPNAWSVCQKNASDGSFAFPTNFGNITINTPANPTDAIMAEVDGILASLNKK
jgi:hypothetical protein